MTSFCKISFFWFCFKQEALVKYIAFNGSPITNPWCTAFLWPPKTLDIEKVEQCGVYNRHSNTGQADTRIPGTSVYWAFCVRYSDAVNELNIRLFSLVFRTPISDV